MKLIHNKDIDKQSFISESKNKQIYYLLIFLPIIMVITLMACIYYVPPIQTLFLSFFSECTNMDVIGTIGLVTLGIGMILLMMPFAFYEFAIGFTCSTYIIPILIVTAAKMIGESLSFFFGKSLAPVLKPLFLEFKFFNAIEILTQRKPFKTQLLMRLSGITPQLIMNYGMGVVGNIKFSTFFLVANISGIPSTILSIFIGKQFNRLRDIFNGEDKVHNQDVVDIELGVCLIGALSIASLIYYVTKEYQKVLAEGLTQISEDCDQTVDTMDLELESAI